MPTRPRPAGSTLPPLRVIGTEADSGLIAPEETQISPCQDRLGQAYTSVTFYFDAAMLAARGGCGRCVGACAAKPMVRGLATCKWSYVGMITKAEAEALINWDSGTPVPTGLPPAGAGPAR